MYFDTVIKNNGSLTPGSRCCSYYEDYGPVYAEMAPDKGMDGRENSDLIEQEHHTHGI